MTPRKALILAYAIACGAAFACAGAAACAGNWLAVAATLMLGGWNVAAVVRIAERRTL